MPELTLYCPDELLRWQENVTNDTTSIIVHESCKILGSNSLNYPNLESVTLPDTLERIEDDPFTNVPLKSLFIPRDVNYMNEANPFNLLPFLERIDVDENNQYFASIDGVLYDKGITKLIEYPSNNHQKTFIVPKSVKSFGIYSFSRHKTIETVVLQASLSLIDKRSFGYVENVTIMLPHRTKINKIYNTTTYPCNLYDSSFIYYYYKMESKEVCLFSFGLKSFLMSYIYVFILQ